MANLDGSFLLSLALKTMACVMALLDPTWSKLSPSMIKNWVPTWLKLQNPNEYWDSVSRRVKPFSL